MTLDRLTAEKTERIRAQVMEAAIAPHDAEELHELLDHSESICNGGGSSLEANSKALGALLRAYVRDRIEASKRCATCTVVLGGWKGMLLQAKWPLAMFASVAVFSPNFARVADIAEKLLK